MKIVTLICQICGKKFTVKKSREHTAKVCSLDCKRKWTGNCNRILKPKRVLFKCSVCKKEISVKPWQAKIKKVCSKECQNKFQSITCSGKNGSFFGKKHTSQFRDKISKLHKNKIVSEKTKALMKQNHWSKGVLKEQWKKTITKAQSKGGSCKPNKIERKVISYIKTHNLPYRYTGNGKFWIERINPDFVNINGEKKALEVQGCYWHNCPVHYPDKGSKRNITNDVKKEVIYKKYGWEVQYIWEHDINNGSFTIK